MRQKIYSLLPEIYDAALSHDGWQPALTSLADAMNAKGAAFMAYDLADRPFFIQAWSSLYTPEAVAEYSQGFAEYEQEIALYLRDVAPRHANRDTDIWPDIEYLQNRPDLAFLRQRFGILRRCAVTLNTHGAWKDCISLQVGHEWGDVPKSFWNLLDTAVPHLSKAAEIGRVFSLLRARHNAALTALDRIGVGMCIALHDGSIVVSNEEAKRIFASADGLTQNRNARITCKNDDLTRQIRDAISATSATAAGESIADEYVIVVPRSSGQTPLLVEICPLRDGEAEIEGRLMGSLICLIDPDQTADFSTDGLAQIFKLTNAESAVCDAMIRGLTTNDIADLRGVSPETVRSQVRSIYNKAGLSSRIDLIRLALLLNPPIR